MDASASVTREKFNTAIGDISAKMKTLMMTMSQLVQGAAPTTTGDGRESSGGRHTAPGADQGGLDHAPNTGEASDWQRHRSASSVGDASRESARGEPPAHHVNPLSSRTPRLRQLNFDGREENWSMFQNDFLTQVHACGIMSYLKDSRDISVHGLAEEEILDQGLQTHEVMRYKDLWVMLVEAITDVTTKMFVYSHKGPAADWRALERNFSSLSGGEQIFLIGKFFNTKKKSGQDPHAFYHQFHSTVTTLEMTFHQPIPKMLVHARFLDALLPEYEIQKQQLLSQKSLETEGILRVLKTRAGHLKEGVEERGKGGKPEHAFAAMGEKGEVKQTRRKKKKPYKDDPDTALIAGSDAKCYVCEDKSHFIQQCPKQICQRCGVKGHHIRECKVEFVGVMVEFSGEEKPF